MVAPNSYADSARHIQEIQMRKIEPASVYLESRSHLYHDVDEKIDGIFRLGVIPPFADVPLGSQTKGLPHGRTRSLAILGNLWKDIRSRKAFVVGLDEAPNRERIECTHPNTVMKRNPDRPCIQRCRAISARRRVNLRINRCDTPPAYVPSVSQICERISAPETRYHGIGVLLAKRDISSAFGRSPAHPDCARVFVDAFGAADMGCRFSRCVGFLALPFGSLASLA